MKSKILLTVIKNISFLCG